MGLETVLSRIVADAQAEARKMEQDGNSEAERILGEARASAARLLSRAEASSRQRVASLRKSEVAKVNAAVRIERLNAKNGVIEEAARGVYEGLSRISQAERKRYYSRLLKAGGREIEARHFYCSQQDKALLSSLAPGLLFAGEIACSGGFVLEDAGRKVRVDYTFEAVMEKVVSDNKKALLKVLFDKNA